MLTGFENYLKANYVKIDRDWENAFRFKEIPTSIYFFYREFTKSQDVFWTPETLEIISYRNGADKKGIEEIKKFSEYNIKRCEGSVYTIEMIPAWYYDFLSHYQSLRIVRGSIVFDSNVAKNVHVPKPKQLDGLFYIGRYSGITPQSAPIFTNEKGEILVFSAKEFRNYPRDKSKEEMLRYLNSTVPLTGKWNNIDEFLVDETPRLEKLYIANPSMNPVKNSAPQICS